jgi:D-alanine transaminase
MEGIAYVNDTFMPLETGQISIEDRGFQLGDGVYEVIKTYNSVPFALDGHLNRLDRSLNMLELPLPKSRKELKRLIREALRRSGFQDALIYLQITRGWAPRQHAFPDKVKPTLVLTVRRARSIPQDLYDHGASAIVTGDERWLRCDIKSICILPNVLAKEKATRVGAFEAILARDDRITEGTSSNVFAIKSGRIYTAPEGNWILSGVTRAHVLDLARRECMIVIEEFFDPEFLISADEVFITNTSFEVMPVVTIDKQSIGDGQPGKITCRLGQLYKEEVLLHTTQTVL